jgi:WD40 repeat protein
MIPANASARTDEPVRVIKLSESGFEQARAVSFSSDGKFLAVGVTSGIYLFDPQTLSTLEFIRTNTWARSVLFAPGSNMLAAGLFDNTIKFWNVPGTELTRTISDPKGWIRSISFSSDGALIASASDDNTVRIWRMSDSSPLLVLDKDTTGVRAVALSPDGTLVATALGDKTVRVWEVPSGKLLYTLNGHEDWVRCLAFSPDGQLLASGSFDKTIRVWNMLNGRLKRTLKGHSSSVLGVTFSPGGEILASGSVDGTVRIWNVSDGAPIRVLQGHTNFVYAVAFSPDGQTLASGSGDNTVRLWDMNVFAKAEANAELPTVSTPSDCRACHHRRGLVEPAPVIELNCESCHQGGIGLSWCAGFPRSRLIEKTPIAYNAVDDVSGVPINDRNLAVIIASPGNGETLYIRGSYMAPEFISGKIFYADPQLLSQVEVRLDIVSGGKTTASLVTHPTENGAFDFNVAIHPTSPPPLLSKPATRQCLVCHGDFVPLAGLPLGDVHLVVTALAPDGQQASDDRWIHVDPSLNTVLPVKVLDNDTNKPLDGLSISASTILYQWRGRFENVISDSHGNAQLTLETLTQAATTYTLSIQPQVVDGILYASSKPVVLHLDSASPSHPILTLTAHAVTGQINGELGGAGVSSPAADARVWAIQLPFGPAYQTSIDSQNMFAFVNIPVSKYLVVPDNTALSKQGLYTTSHTVDLFESPVSSVIFLIGKGRSISGRIAAKNGDILPFAWVTIGDYGSAQIIDPTTGKFAISNFPSDAAFITITAPGYYSLPQSIRRSTESLDVQLVPRPELREIPWGDGQVVLPPESKGTANGLAFNLEYGWLWGQNALAQPLEIHLPGADIRISSGQFALEQPADGTGWLYMKQGQAEVLYDGGQDSVKVESRQMIAMVGNASPFPIEPVVVTSLHLPLEEEPVFEIIEPTFSARIQSWLVKTGIGAMQTITFITYILSLVTLIAIPVAGLFSYWKKRRNSSHSQENH